MKKETLAEVFSCEFCDISKNSFFYKTLLVAASAVPKIFVSENLKITKINMEAMNLKSLRDLMVLCYGTNVSKNIL